MTKKTAGKSTLANRPAKKTSKKAVKKAPAKEAPVAVLDEEVSEDEEEAPEANMANEEPSHDEDEVTGEMDLRDDEDENGEAFAPEPNPLASLPKGTRIIATPAGKCPVTLKETDAESVMLWADQVRDIGLQRDPPYLYSLSALLYWVRRMELKNGQVKDVERHLNALYQHERSLQGIAQPKEERSEMTTKTTTKATGSKKNAKANGKSTSPKAAKHSTPKGGRAVGIKIFDKSATSVVRWMAKQGWSFSEIRYVLDHVKAKEIKDTTIRAQTGMAHRGEGEIATLTGAEQKELKALKAKASK